LRYNQLFLWPTSDNPQFMHPVTGNRFPIPALTITVINYRRELIAQKLDCCGQWPNYMDK